MKRFYEGSSKKQYWMSTLSRALFIITMFLICMTGINLLDFMDVAGSICNSYLAFILPVWVYVYYMEKQGKMGKLNKWAHILMAVVGFTMSMITLGFGIYSMVHGNKHAKVYDVNPLAS